MITRVTEWLRLVRGSIEKCRVSRLHGATSISDMIRCHGRLPALSHRPQLPDPALSRSPPRCGAAAVKEFRVGFHPAATLH